MPSSTVEDNPSFVEMPIPGSKVAGRKKKTTSYISRANTEP